MKTTPVLQTYCRQCKTMHDVLPEYNAWTPISPHIRWQGVTVVGDRHLECGRRQHLVIDYGNLSDVGIADLVRTGNADLYNTFLCDIPKEQP